MVAPIQQKITPDTPPSLANLDRRTAARFRKGKREIEAKLDLHGLTREAAQEALFSFVRTAAARQRRSLLVVTGKGARGGARGVLQEAVPGWLRLPEMARLVLAFEQAQPKDGGSGALYLLLKRAREKP